MRRKDFEKPKKIVFEKLKVKEEEKVRGGENTEIPLPLPGRPCIKYVGCEHVD